MSEVLLHIYDVTNSASARTNNVIVNLNKIMKDAIGVGGIFHSAVEVYGEEWSFGFCENGTGVFSCPPKQNPMYTYRESIFLGHTHLSATKVNQTLKELSREWPGYAYDLLSKNCNHFCDSLCERLGVQKLPGWVNRFANAGDAAVDVAENTAVRELGSSDKSFCRSCLVHNVGHLEILHHNISAPHIKKLRAQIRLRCYCMICSVNLLNIKAAEIHVQDVRDEWCMSRGFKVARFADQTYKCCPCGIAFSCSIALELHLVMSHKVTFSKHNLPELTGIIKLLSGSSSDCSKAGINLECLLCSVKCEAIDDFVLHLFSSVHIKSLRTSTCLVCEKHFIHVNDRESHLHAYKHKFQLQKVCLSNRLKKVKDMGHLENMGYLCTYCMIWCKSWPCFMLHLLGSAHKLYAEIQDQPHTNKVVQTRSQEEKKEVEVPETHSPLMTHDIHYYIFC